MTTSLSFIFILTSIMSFSQGWKLIDSIKTSQTIVSTSVDSKGFFYVGTSSGSIIRYDINGEEDEYFSELNNSSVTNIQAWNRLKVFSFFREQQTVSILDRFTTTPKNIYLRDLQLQYAWLFAPGIDNSYWALSAELKELIKYDDQNLNILFRIPLKNNIKINNASFLRAYKNLLLLVDEQTGVWVFDQYGDFRGVISEKGIKQIEIKNNLLITTNGDEFLEIDPFDLKVTKRKNMPKGSFWAVVVSDNKFVFFGQKRICIYQ